MPRAVFFLCSLLLVGITQARAQQAADDHVVVLTAADDHSRWVVTGCEAEFANGELLLKAGDGFVRTCHPYRDFILELEYFPVNADDWDSGIYIRSDLPPEGKHWPEKTQINLKRGYEGNLLGFPKAVSTDLAKPKQWNAMKITCRGANVAVELNGQPAWSIDNFEEREGYIGFQAEVPGGGQFRFRNVKITELGFHSLFDGKSLEGWSGAGAPAEMCWSVEEGLLVCSGKPGPWLRSNDQFGDYNLRLEYQLLEGGNSGVYVRVPEDGNHHGDNAGIEVQILDDNSAKYKELQPYQYTGSLYAIVPANPRVCRVPGEWNTLEIECVGTSYRVVHNGIVVINAKETDNAELAKRRVEGFLGLQNHSERVAFRNLRLAKPSK
jgi:hypothetical protein